MSADISCGTVADLTRASLDGVAILLTDNTQASCDMPCFTWTHIVGYDYENHPSPYYVHCYPFWESELISTRQKTIIERLLVCIGIAVEL